MTTAVVGGARVEFTADLAKFGESAKAQLTAALESPALADTVTAGFEKASAGVGAVGKQAATEFASSITTGAGQVTAAASEVGEAASTGMAEGVTAGSAKVTAATEATVTEAGAAAKTKAAEQGAEAGGAFSDGMLENLKGLATAAVPLLGVLAGGELVKSSVEAADQLEGANIKIENVFGESGGAVQKWASGVSTSLRESQLQAETTAGSFGGFLNGLGVSKEQSAGLSEQLTSLTANMAAFNNADPASVQQALQGALKGRTAGLKQYGVTLTDAQVQQEALSHATELGLTVTNGTVGPLNTQQKALATLYAVMDSTKGQQGALASSSDTLKAKQQVLSAEFDNFKATLGTYLLPILARVAGYITTDVIPALITVGQWVQRNQGWLKPLAEAIGAVVAGFLAWKLGVAAWEAITEAATAVQAAFNAVMDANPIMLVVLAVAALVLGLIYAYNHSKTFRDIINDIFSVLKKVGAEILDFFTKTLPKIFNDFIAWIKQWGLLLLGPIGVIIKYWSQISGFFSKLWSDIEGYFTTAITWLKQAGQDIINGLWAGIQFAWKIIYDWFIGWPLMVVGYYLDALQWLNNAGRDLMNGLWDGIHSVWNSEVAAFENIGSTVKGWFNGAIGWLTQAGTDIITGLLTGIQNAAKGAASFAADIANDIKNGINVSLHLPIKVPSFDTHIPGVGSIGGFTLLPRLAQGGMTQGAGTFVMGDNPSGQEVALPLDSPATTTALSIALSKAMDNGPATQFASGASTSTDPELISAIMAIASRPIIVQVGSKTIAKAANTGNKALARIR